MARPDGSTRCYVSNQRDIWFLAIDCYVWSQARCLFLGLNGALVTITLCLLAFFLSHVFFWLDCYISDQRAVCVQLDC